MLGGQLRGALHQQHPMGGRVSCGQRADAAIELVAENPHRLHGHSVTGVRRDAPTGTRLRVTRRSS